MKAAVFALMSATMLFMAGCASIDGPDVTINKYGPVPPSTDASHSSSSAVPLYGLFQVKEAASRAAASATTYNAATDAANAKAMLIAGSDLIKQNCDDYFDSSGRLERRLLFGRDVTTFAGAVGTSAAVATRASAGTIAGVALGTTSLLSANDSFRNELTFGAEYSTSVHTLIKNNLQTMIAADLGKDLSVYTYGLSLADLRDLQDVCMPAQIVEYVKTAIAGAQFAAIDVTAPGTKLPTAGQQPAGAPAPAPAPGPAAAVAPDVKAKAAATKNNLQLLLPNDLRVIALAPALDQLAAGVPVAPVVTPPAQQSQAPQSGQIAADHRIKLVPVSPAY